MRSRPDYDREKWSVTWGSSATTALDYTLSASEAFLLHSMLVVGHSWGGGNGVTSSGSSGASGGIVSIRDMDDTVIMTFDEVLTGSTTLMSADIMVFPNYTFRYSVTTDGKSATVVSAAAVPTAYYPTATVILYKY